MKQLSFLQRKLIFCLLGITLALNVLWITFNHAPPAWDSASHIWISLQILSFIRQGNLHGILIASNYYPILIHTLTALFMLILSPSIVLSQYLALLYYITTLYIIYLYTSTHFKNKQIGFITAAIFSFMPIVYDQAHWLMLDIPLTGIIFLCLYIFEKSQAFEKKITSIWFFVALAGLIMTKWTGVIFLVIPALFIFSNKETLRTLPKRLPIILLGISITILLCLPWYLANYHSLINQLTVSLTPDGSDPQHFFSVDNFSDYLYLFINFQASPFLGLLSVLAFLYLIIKIDKNGIFLVLCIVFGYLFFTSIGNKDPRYTMPLLPFACMLLAYTWTKLKKARVPLITPICIALLVFLGLGSLGMQFRQPPLDNIRITVPVPIIGSINLIDINDELVQKYDPHHWPIENLFRILENKTRNKNDEMVVVFEDEHMNPSTLQAYLKLYQLQGQLPNFTIKTPDIYFLQNTFHADKFPDNTAIDSYLADTKYVLVSSKGLGVQLLRNKYALGQIQYRILSNTLTRCDHFTVTVTPKGITCYIGIGEKLQTGSDVKKNDDPVSHGQQIISGYTKVECPWGCSFSILETVSQEKPFTVTLLKHFILPDKKTVDLYQLSPREKLYKEI